MRMVTRDTASCASGTSPSANLSSRDLVGEVGLHICTGPGTGACGDHGACTRQKLGAGLDRVLAAPLSPVGHRMAPRR